MGTDQYTLAHKARFFALRESVVAAKPTEAQIAANLRQSNHTLCTGRQIISESPLRRRNPTPGAGQTIIDSADGNMMHDGPPQCVTMGCMAARQTVADSAVLPHWRVRRRAAPRWASGAAAPPPSEAAGSAGLCTRSAVRGAYMGWSRVLLGQESAQDTRTMMKYERACSLKTFRWQLRRFGGVLILCSVKN